MHHFPPMSVFFVFSTKPFFFFFYSSPGIWAARLTKQTNVSASCRFWLRNSSGTWRRSAAGRTDWTPIWLRFWSGWECAPRRRLGAIHAQYYVYMKVNRDTFLTHSGQQQRLQSVWGGQQRLWDHHHQQKKSGNWNGLKSFVSWTIFDKNCVSFNSINIDLCFFSVWGNEQWDGGKQGACRQPPHWAAEAAARLAECPSGEQQHEGLKYYQHTASFSLLHLE